MQAYDFSCGAAALATLLLNQHGDRVSEREVATGLMKRREYVDDPYLVMTREGFSLLDLKRYVERRGYFAEGYGQLTWQELQGIAPVLVPVNFNGYNHFVVFQGTRGGDAFFADPAWGNRTMASNRFQESWQENPNLGKIGFSVHRSKPVVRRAQSTRNATPDANQSALPHPSEPQAEVDSVPSEASDPAGEAEVSEAAAARALERSLTQSGNLLLPWGLMELQLTTTYARTEQRAATLIFEEEEAALGVIDLRRDDYSVSLEYRLGLPFDAQLEATLPYRAYQQAQIEPTSFTEINETTTGSLKLDDITIGLAKTAYSSSSSLPEVIGRVWWNTGTGDVEFARGFQRVGAAMSLLKQQDPLVFAATAGYERLFARDGRRPGDELNLSLTTLLAASPDTSLSVSLDQVLSRREEVNGVDLPGTDLQSTSLTIGATSVLSPSVLLSVLGGIGLTSGAPNYFLGVALPVRVSVP